MRTIPSLFLQNPEILAEHLPPMTIHALTFFALALLLALSLGEAATVTDWACPTLGGQLRPTLTVL